MFALVFGSADKTVVGACSNGDVLPSVSPQPADVTVRHRVKTVYFDSSAFGDLWRSQRFSERERLRLRRRLVSSRWHARPQFIIGQHLVSEMAQHGDLTLRDDQVRFLQSLPDVHCLKSPRDRIRAEVLAATTGAPAEVMLDPDERHDLLHRVLKDDTVWKEERDFLSQAKQTFIEAEESARGGIVQEAGGRKALAAAMNGWFQDPERVVADWATGMMRRRRREFGLGPSANSWPKPQLLRTVWATTAYKLARIYLLNRDQRRLDPNDFPDWGHYIAAVYADTFIVEDRHFRDVVAHCPAPKPEVISFTDWARAALSP